MKILGGLNLELRDEFHKSRIQVLKYFKKLKFCRPVRIFGGGGLVPLFPSMFNTYNTYTFTTVSICMQHLLYIIIYSNLPAVQQCNLES